MVTAQEILNKIRNHSKRSLSLQELTGALQLSKKARRQVKELLQALVQQGRLVRLPGHRFGLPEAGPIAGRLSVHPNGYGFVSPTEGDGPDLFIGPRSMGDAMDGDRVLARIRALAADGSREGVIIRVLERAHRQIVGRFEMSRTGRDRFGFVVPQNPRIQHDVYISKEAIDGARDGDLVVAELTRYPTPERNPEGRIVRVLGVAGDPAIDTEMVLEEYALPRHFPKRCEEDARRLAGHAPEKEIKHRTDLRSLPTITIDGEQARDFDDAVSIEWFDTGDRGEHRQARYRLWVHIADVDQYVPWGTPLDLEARQRANSVYFPDKVIPMFPEALSNGICSLNPKEDRLTVTVEMLFDASGRRLDYRIYPSAIRSDARMTYTQVREILCEPDTPLKKRYAWLLHPLTVMQQLCEALRRRRMERGSLDFDLPEPEIILDVQGQTAQILKAERNIAHRIIEEFMLAANETVAEHLTRLGTPTLYRVHEAPDPAKLVNLNRLIEGFGLKPVSLHQARPRSLQEILEAVRDKPEERLINTVMLRSLRQARYSVERLEHFGLATDCYTHFTSPIRRYPDLVVHRILKANLRGHGGKTRSGIPSAELLSEIATHCSERERLAMEVERKVVEIKKVRYMADKIGQVFPGHVSGVVPAGLFVELDEIFVEGLIPVSSLTDDEYIFQESMHRLIGARKRRIFRLGDPIQVLVQGVDLVRFRIDFALAGAGHRTGAPLKKS